MRKGKRIVATLLTTILVASGALNNTTVLAVEINDSTDNQLSSITKLEGTKLLDEIKNEMEESADSYKNVDLGYQPEDEVKIIVELKEDSLLDTYTSALHTNKTKSEIEFNEYAKSSTGKTLNSEILKQQNSVLKKNKQSW